MRNTRVLAYHGFKRSGAGPNLGVDCASKFDGIFYSKDEPQ